MNSNIDETDRSAHPGLISSTTTTNNIDEINSKLNNNITTTINHPLSIPLIDNNKLKDSFDDIDDDDDDNDNLTEITLKSTLNTGKSTIKMNVDSENNNNNNNNSNNKDSKKKWVKFDDEDGSGSAVSAGIAVSGGNDDINKSITNGNLTTTQILHVNNLENNNIVSNNNINISNLEIEKKISPKLPPPPQSLQNKMLINAPVSSTTSTHLQTHKSVPSTSIDVAGAAVLTTESVHVNLNNSSISPQKPNSTINPNNSNSTSITTTSTSSTNQTNPSKSVAISMNTPIPPMRTIELSTGRVREGFANGDVIVTLLPTNTKWPWITPAVFRPELVPEELMAQGLTLTVEEYVNAMETLVNDYRFTVYNICYKRVLICWIIFAFCVLLTLLFSGLQGIALFSLGVAWLFLNAAAIFFCMWMKLRLSRGLEKCLARVNKQLLRHKILLVLDDRGRISCHKVNLCFMYFDPELCIAYLNEFIERHEQNGTNIQAGWEKKLDLDVNDIVIQGTNPVRLSRKQELSVLLYLRYGSRWGNEIVRGLGDVSSTEPARHCANYICPCQYIERHLACKPRGKFKMFNLIYWVLASEHYEN